METCKTLFSKCINTLNNYTSFEDYYDYLKNQDETNTFCEYYLRDKKESYLYKENRLTLSRLKGGIPQLLLMECLNFQDIKSTGHYIMLK